MGKSEQSRSYLAEGIVKSLLEDNGVKTTRIIKADKGNSLNEEILNLFLRIHSKDEKLLELLKELNLKGFELPDFLCLAPKTNEPFFHEVKTENRKLKLSDLRKAQREAIKIIAKEGYVVHITNVRFGIELNENEEDNDYSNKEQGKVLRGELIPKDSKIKVEMKQNYIKPTNYNNIFIEELEVTDYFG